MTYRQQTDPHFAEFGARMEYEHHVPDPTLYPGPFTVMAVSCDGASFYKEGSEIKLFASYTEALLFANKKQRLLGFDNPFGFTQQIRCRAFRRKLTTVLAWKVNTEPLPPGVCPVNAIM